MDVTELGLSGFWAIERPAFADDRGFLAKPFDALAFEGFGWQPTWKQVIHSHTAKRNTIRGLYVQLPPYTEGKLVTCLSGRSFWVVVDLRRGSPTFGAWKGETLEWEDGRSLLIEPGFGHGCLSLSNDTDLLLLADNVHAEAPGRGIAWNDPDLAIEWPLLGADPVISAAHAAYPSFKAFREAVGGV